jgi:thioredoxin-related protein
MDLDPNMPEPAILLSFCHLTKCNYDNGLRDSNTAGLSCDDPDVTHLANKALTKLNISLDKIRELPLDILKDLADASNISDMQKAINSKEKPVFIYFFEKQCPISLELADALKDLKDKHSSEVAFFVIDVANEPDAIQLVNSYGVKTTPTMVIIKRDGTIAGTYDGYVDNRELEKWILDAK